MGVERIVELKAVLPTWQNFVDNLLDRGEAPILRMIDGLPAFPDELPPDDWKELRITLQGGMITFRRTNTEIRVVTWGSNDPELLRALDLCVAVWSELAKAD